MTVTESERSFFRASGPIARPLAIAVLWAFAVAFAGGALVGLSALIAGGVALVMGLFNDSASASAAMGETLRIAAWIFAPIGLGVAVWVAAYGSTEEGSLPRTIVAAPAAVGVAVGLLLLDSSGLLAAGLAIGWALAIPAESPTHIAARSLPMLVVALTVPRLDDLSTWTLVAYLAVSPLAAAISVYLGNLPWSLRGGEPGSSV
jgi:hypothetical protein